MLPTGEPQKPSVPSYRRQVVQSFLWQGAAQAAGQAVSWLAAIVVIRLLAPADYGLMAMANVFLGFFFLFADLGFGAATIQAPDLDREQLRRMLGIVFAMNAAGCLLTLGAAPLLARFFEEPRLVPVLRVLSINFLLLAAYVLPQSQLMRELDFRTKARVDILAVVLASLTTLGLALAGWGVWALVGGALVTHGVKALAFNLLRPIAVAPLFSLQAVTRLAQFGALVTLDRLLFFLYGQADVVIGGRILGKEALGVYAVALSLAAVPMDKLLPIVTQVSFAAYSRIQSEPDRVRRNLLRSVRLVSLICFPAFLGLAAIAGDLVAVFLGPRWQAVVLPIQLLCLVLPLKTLSALLSPPLFGVGRPAVNVVNTALSLGVMVVAFLVGVRYGVVGLCLAWLIGYPGIFGVISWRSLRALGIPASDFLHQCGFALGASLAMASGVLALRESLGAFGTPGLRLVVLVSAGVLIYAGLWLVFQRSTVRELVAMVRS